MLRIPRSAYDEIRRHAVEIYPAECCGVLLGARVEDIRTVEAAIRCRNAEEVTCRTRYRIDAAELVRIQRESRERGLAIVGFYHSHPDHPAGWSQADLDQAFWTGCSYLIVSVSHGEAGDAKAFVLRGTAVESRRLEEEDLVLE